MRVEYELTGDDYWAFQRYTMMWRLWWLTWPLLVAIAGMLVYIALLYGVLALVPMIVVAAGFYAVVRWSIRRAPARRGTVLGRHTMTLGEQGVREEGAHGVVEFRWNPAMRLGETRDHAFLFTDRVQGFIVPRRALAAGDADRLRELVRAHTTG